MKIIPKLVFIGAIIATIFLGKDFIDKKTFKYEDTVNKTITNYFISGNTSELKPLQDLLDSYKPDDNIVYNIQTYSNDNIWSWFEYVDGKYTCNKANLNSCQVQLEEFKILQSRLNSLYSAKSPKNNHTLMLQSSYNNISSEVKKKLTDIEKIINSPSAKNPSDSEQIRQKKCSVVQDCTNCRDGVCTCTYVSEGRSEEIKCNKDTEDK